MSRPGPAFSNSTEWEIWSYNWCDRCLVDAPYRNGIADQGCPLILAVMLGEVPDEFLEQPDGVHDYHCINFRPPGWRDPEPHPKPEPPQDGLFDRPERGVRMLLPLDEQEPTRPPQDRRSGKGVRVCAHESRPAAGADLTSSLTIRPPERKAAGRVAHARTGGTGPAREAVQA